jgi:hypothetical protein
MDEAKTAPVPALDDAPVGVKIPKWLKQLAAQVGEMTGEDIGEVIRRHAGESITREYRRLTAAVVRKLGDEDGPVLHNSIEE